MMMLVSTPAARLLAIAGFTLSLSACATLPASGPSTRSVEKASDGPTLGSGVEVIDVNDAVIRAILAGHQHALFSESLGDGVPIGSMIGKGDTLDITIWEAPPAALFGTAGGSSESSSQSTSSVSIARSTALPEQMVDSDGEITVPFVGRVQADGRTPQQIARDITGRLIGKAHQPQAIVRLARNSAANVTVVGDVANSARVPLTAHGERILDILASAGGVKQPVGKTTVQITRNSRTVSMPLETVIRDARQNVRLQTDDIVTVLFQPLSFTALGAVGKSEEIPFEATGITLAQAMGRIAGLQDSRADPKGVFIFRLEDPASLLPDVRATAKITPDGRVPVIYRINMKDPAAFFVSQSFPIEDKDVLYVSNAPLADFQKFVGAIFSTVLPAATAATVIAN